LDLFVAAMNLVRSEGVDFILFDADAREAEGLRTLR